MMAMKSSTRRPGSTFSRFFSLLTLFFCFILGGSFVPAQVNVLTQHNNLARTGANLDETILTPSTVDKKHFGLLFKRVVDDQVYGQPLYVSNVQISGGTHDIVYITTVNNSVYAFDANDPSSSTPFWHVNFGVPASLSEGKFGCSDMNGNMGITGTPVIDLPRKTLYVVSLTKVGDGFVQRLHALDIATGADLSTSPVTIKAPEFNALMQNQRPALLLSRGIVYVGYASHCDKLPYHGYLLGYDAKSLVQTGIFNTSTGGEGASIWQSGQAPAVDAAGNIYFVTGNGTWDGKSSFSESFIKLSPQLKLLDWFTPTNYAHLDAIDADVDASGATLIPGTNLVLDGGKAGFLYIVDKNHMGHLGDIHAVQGFQATSSHLHSIVYWNSAKNGQLIYLWGQRDQLRAYKFSGEKLLETPFQIRPERNQGHPGAMVSLSANGNKDGILWAAIHASGDSWHESRPGILHAYDADNIQHELWNSLENPARDDCNNYSKMAPPTIANGKVYLASFGTKNIGSGQFCVYGMLPNGPAPSSPQGMKAVEGDGEVALSWNPTPQARTYNLAVASQNGDIFTTVARGLTSPTFIDRNALKGYAYRYIVTAVNSNGESVPSEAVTIALFKARSTRHVSH